jgi:hypothetical protein
MTRADDEQRRALAVLADNPDGYTRASMLARGFSLALLNRLVRVGLASSRLDWAERDGEPAATMRLRITDAGRRALQ